MLILKRISLPYCSGSSNLAFFSVHVSLCCIVVCCVSQSVAVRLDICSKLVWKKLLFFRIFQWVCLISSLSQTQFDCPQRCKDAYLTYSYSSLTINLCFGPLLSSHEVWAWGVTALCILKCKMHKIFVLNWSDEKMFHAIVYVYHWQLLHLYAKIYNFIYQSINNLTHTHTFLSFQDRDTYTVAVRNTCYSLKHSTNVICILYYNIYFKTYILKLNVLRLHWFFKCLQYNLCKTPPWGWPQEWPKQARAGSLLFL
jgi:hypothetical protein